MVSSNVTTQLKRCTKCKQWFPKNGEYFGNHRMGRDGLKAACKACTNTQNAEYKQTELGQQANQRYLKGEAGKRSRSSISRRYATNSPEKRRAKNAVIHAVEAGKLPAIAGCQCRHCGAQSEHYHHWSYAPEHWLDVIPLCVPCHKLEHSR